MFAGNFPPNGWQFCNGQTMSISQNAALFSLIGTTYGGNGQTTFALPNLQGRIPLHWGTSPGGFTNEIGQTGGSTTVTLNDSTMPAHSHQLLASSDAPTLGSPNGNFLSQPLRNGPPLYAPTSDVTLFPGSVNLTGDSQPFTREQPYLVVSFIIALFGIFPSRN
jgi:microcystin-dependent protein